jgi:drug/metabolite transporter (DMT)-like permease
MIPIVGEIFAILAAFCYAFGSVAATKNARENGGRGNAVLLSIVLTAGFSGGLWLMVGPSLPPLDADVWVGVAIFVVAGILATVLGRIFFFRSIELAGAIETGLIRRLIPVFAAVLAIFFLGETLTAASALAFALVFAAVALVVVMARGGAAAEDADAVRASRERNAGRILAMLSAASYGGSYVTRKLAMRWLPDPLLGAFIGAVAAAAPFSPEYRRQLAAVLRRPTGWQLVAAASISLGQTAQFVALRFTTVTAVAIIGTIEMFLAAWLAAWVLRTEARPGPDFAVGSILAMAGVIVLALARA